MTTVLTLATQLQLLPRIEAALRRLAPGEAEALWRELSRLPVKRSHATRRLGSYVARGGVPLGIRLQFAQEPQLLVETFLHELAHACDHLTHQAGRPYRRAHGPGWQAWAAAFGIAARACGESAALRVLHAQRLKVVAVCRRCGAEFQRVRALRADRRYLHPGCGGQVVPVGGQG